MTPLNIKIIRIDCGTQSRAEINQAVVDQYAEAIKDGADFPPVRVFHDGNFYYLADGFHRYFAHLKAERAGIKAEVVNGTLRDAILYSFSANALHGLQRNIHDKRKIVTAMLEDFEWRAWSDREIARLCHVSHTFVANMRESMNVKDDDTRKYKTSTGKVAERKTVNERKPAKEPVLKEKEPAPQQEFDARDELIDTLTKENEQLTDRLAVAATEGTDEEKKMAEQTIADLREKVRILEIELTAVKSSRDTYQAENMQLKKQVAMLNKKLKAYEEIQ